MILEVKEVAVERTSPRAAKTKRVIVYRCDQCGCTYEGKYTKKFLADRQYHFCSVRCLGVSRSHGGVAVEFQLASRDMDLWQASVQQSLLRRYGVTNPSSLEWVKQKKIATTRAHYGVDNPQQDPEIKRRTIETHASHGRNWMSKPEKEFRLVLEDLFGKDDVRVQVLLERKWSVDFYIRSIDTYVQFDGVYWHGLDRPIEVIKSSMNKRDKAIYDKWVKDREFDAYVAKRGLRLVRVTDKEYVTDLRSCLFKIQGSPCHVSSSRPENSTLSQTSQRNL